MKQISQQDIEHLRKTIRDRHDLVLSSQKALNRVLPTDHQQMLRRLKHANKQMDRFLALPDGITTRDPRVQALHQELDELRMYFGAPTGRPLTDRGVEFAPLYIQALRMMFQISPSSMLYMEIIRTDLALLEYRIKHRQHITNCLRSLMDNIVLYNYHQEFHDRTDFTIFDLGHYLQLICQELEPLMHNQKNAALLDLICQTHLEIATAFYIFKCAPEKTGEQFFDSFLLSMLVQMTHKKPSKDIAMQCCITVRWLWTYQLRPEQKDQAAYFFRKAQEVLNHA